MILSFEFQQDLEELDIVTDAAGLGLLIDKLEKLKSHGGHTHLMTPSWGGQELTEDRQTAQGVLINHVRLVLMPS